MKLHYSSQRRYTEDAGVAYTLLIAIGRIEGTSYDHAKIDNETKPGTVPEWFKENARRAFIRRYLLIRSQRK